MEANTKAYQDNWLAVEQGQEVCAGIGGDGGDHNKAEGGDVHIKASIESANLNDVLNDSKYFHIDDFVHVQLIDTCEGWDRRPSAAGSQFVA